MRARSGVARGLYNLSTRTVFETLVCLYTQSDDVILDRYLPYTNKQHSGLSNYLINCQCEI